MAGFLRSIGIINASIWFGTLIFFTIAAGPAFFSTAMLQLLGRPHAGAAAQIVIERYFYLQQWCAGIAIAHLLTEWLYLGKPFQRFILFMLMGLFTVSILGGAVLQPRMKQLHLEMYSPQSPASQREAARGPFRMLHGLASITNLLVICGVMVYLISVTTAPSARFSSLNKYKS